MLAVRLHLVLGSCRSFFTGETNFLEGTGDGASTDIPFPQRCHLGLRLIAMHFSKGPKLVPICNLVSITRRVLGLSLKVSGLSPSLQLQVNGVAADLEYLRGFAFLHPIHLNCLDDLLAQVVTVGICHLD